MQLLDISNSFFMDTTPSSRITVRSTVEAPVEKVWKCWTEPEHIVHWNNASDDWHTPRAENDLRVGGRFLSRMESRDGQMGFDFTGEYTDVITNEQIAYTMEDGRQVIIKFQKEGDNTEVIEQFDAENTHSEDMQRSGWQAILDNFKRYVENQNIG